MYVRTRARVRARVGMGWIRSLTHSLLSSPSHTRRHNHNDRVYVTMAELEACPEEQILLEWNDISMSLTVKLSEGKVSELCTVESERLRVCICVCVPGL